MASGTVFDAVRAHIEQNFTAAPVVFENEPEPQTRNSETGETIPAWVAVKISGDLYGQMSIGADEQKDNRWDEEGSLWLHVFVPIGSGGSAIRHLAKQLADLFRGTTLLGGDLEFLDASIGMGQPGDEKRAWYGVSVQVGWRRMEA